MECRGDGPNAVGPCNGPSLAFVSRRGPGAVSKQAANQEAAFQAAVALAEIEQGFTASGVPWPGSGDWFRIASLATGFTQRGRLNSHGDFENLILAPNEFYLVTYFNPSRRRVGGAIFRSAANGATTTIPGAILQPDAIDGANDPDGDGLSEVVEHVLGTSATLADSDGDGIKDGPEVFSGTNPLDGVGLPKGVVSVVPTPGAATDVAAGNNLAVVACQGGLLVVDLSEVQSPVRLAVVPGFAKAVALRGSLALVAFESDVRLLDLAVPAMPQTLWSHTELGNADAVEFGRNSALVVKGTTLQRLDLITGVAGGTVNLPTRGTSIRVRADLAYVLSLSNLAVCRDDDLLGLIEVISVPGESIASRPRLSLGGDFLYGSRFNGINVFDLTDPTRP
ncbi:MAG: hypothetical protein L0Z50_30325, partial [Verrucomicrobiales bacterium]|nr:hypothetical protein [Verrucomicrobiales bacterium]